MLQWCLTLCWLFLEWFGVRHHWNNFLFSKNAPVVSHPLLTVSRMVWGETPLGRFSVFEKCPSGVSPFAFSRMVWGETPLGRLVVFEQCFSGVSPSVDCFSNGLGWDTTGAVICFRKNALVVSRPLFMVSGMVWSTSGGDFLFSKNHRDFGRWKGADYVGFNRFFWNYLGPTWGLPWPTSRLPWACGPTWELEMLIFHWF